MTAPNPRPSLENTLADHVARIRKLEAVPPAAGVVQLRPPQMMGQAQPFLMAGKNGTVPIRSRGGIAYRPDADVGLLTGDHVKVDFFSQDDVVLGQNTQGKFTRIGARVHEVADLKLDDFNPRQPWQSDPWFGGAAGVSDHKSPLGGDWDGYFYCFVVVSANSGDLIHFSTPGGAINSNEQYSFDCAQGHVGYLFHNFVTSETGDITVTGMTTTAFAFGFIRMQRLSTGTMLGADLGSDDVGTSNQADVTLTGDVTPGNATIVMTYSVDALAPAPGTTPSGLAGMVDPMGRPVVWDYRSSGDETTTQTPHYLSDGRWWPILTPAENRNP